MKWTVEKLIKCGYAEHGDPTLEAIEERDAYAGALHNHLQAMVKWAELLAEKAGWRPENASALWMSIEAATAALDKKTEPPCLSNGWRLVPEKLTPEMIEAMWDAMPFTVEGREDDGEATDDAYQSVYTAALKHAPEQPHRQCGGFVAGMKAAAILCDQEAHSAKIVLTEHPTNAASRARVEGIQNAAEGLASSIRFFAADPGWVAEASACPSPYTESKVKP